jgi:hypothetical protein
MVLSKGSFPRIHQTSPPRSLAFGANVPVLYRRYCPNMTNDKKLESVTIINYNTVRSGKLDLGLNFFSVSRYDTQIRSTVGIVPGVSCSDFLLISYRYLDVHNIKK